MLRAILLYFSEASWARNLIMNFFVARRVARRFVAGETLEEAAAVVKKLNAQGLTVTLDYLGESVHTEADARQAVEQYRRILDAINKHDLQATVSLKLTQLGLDLAEQTCLANMQAILTHAARCDIHVTIDMESSTYTAQTLQIFRALRQDHGFTNLGTVIQAYLYRSEQDMQDLHTAGAFIRLCKGAYNEPPDRAFPEKVDVDANFVKLMKAYVNDSSSSAYLAVASHDAAIIDEMRRYAADAAISRETFEFQMLYGIRADLQKELVQQGYTMRVYVPFGTQWYPYFMRRLAERPANLWFFVSNLLRR